MDCNKKYYIFLGVSMRDGNVQREIKFQYSGNNDGTITNWGNRRHYHSF
jgi:hypothetical protein